MREKIEQLTTADGWDGNCSGDLIFTIIGSTAAVVPVFVGASRYLLKRLQAAREKWAKFTAELIEINTRLKALERQVMENQA